MPRSPKLLPAQVPGWPHADDIARQAGDVPDDVRHAAQLLARWTTEIRRRMHTKGLSQKTVGEASGTSLRTVSRTLSGAGWPELPTLVAISAALGGKLPGADVEFEGRLDSRCRDCEEQLQLGGGSLRSAPEVVWQVVAAQHGRTAGAWDDTGCPAAEALVGAGFGWGPQHCPPDYAGWWQLTTRPLGR